MSFVIGSLIFTILLGSIITIVFKRETELIASSKARHADIKIVEKLVLHAKLHNAGKNIDEVISNLKTLDFEYNPQNCL